MTIYDIAKRAGVSTATVSRYLNGTGYVGKDAAERIAEAVREYDYTPSGIAQKLSSGGKLKLIGVVCRNVEDPYYARAVAILERQLRLSGYEIILSCAGESVEEKRAAVAMLTAKSADAIIFIGSVFMDLGGEVIREAARKLPCFVINASVDGDNVYSAYCDDYAAVRECAAEMLAAGRKKLLYLHDVDTYGSEKKLAGYLSAGGGAYARCPSEFDGILAEFPRLYEQYRPDGVLCSNDVVAAAVLAAAKAMGVDVPHALAVAGHNNSIVSRCTSPTLTTIDNRVDELSLATAKNVVALFSGDDVAKVYKAGYELVRRQSF